MVRFAERDWRFSKESVHQGIALAEYRAEEREGGQGGLQLEEEKS